jgi:hypothetical protein
MVVIRKQQGGQLAATPRPALRNSPAVQRSAWDFVKSWRILLYGQSRTGKTTDWASFPGPILALVCSSGTRPGELRSINTPENRKKIDARIVDSTTQLKKITAEEANSFETVVLDHVGGLQDLCLKEILGLPEVPVQRPIIADNKKTWGEVAGDFKECIRGLLNIRGHLVVVGHERVFKGDDDGMAADIIAPVVNVEVTPAICRWLNKEFDYVCQKFIRPKMIEQTITQNGKEVKIKKRGRGVEFCYRVGHSDLFYTKFRMTLDKALKLPEVITIDKTDSAYVKIKALIDGALIDGR